MSVIGAATGLQKKFSWTAVAAAGISAMASNATTKALKVVPGDFGNLRNAIGNIAATGASTVASAATRSLLDGGDFGDNIVAALPDAIGNVIAAKLTYDFSVERTIGDFAAEWEAKNHKPLSPKDEAALRLMIQNGQSKEDLRAAFADRGEDLGDLGPLTSETAKTVYEAVLARGKEEYTDESGRIRKNPFANSKLRNSNMSAEDPGSAREIAYLADWVERIDEFSATMSGDENFQKLRNTVADLAIATDAYFDFGIKGLLSDGLRRVVVSKNAKTGKFEGADGASLDSAIVGLDEKTLGLMANVRNENNESGFFGALYVDDKRNALIWANRGTENSAQLNGGPALDWGTDLINGAAQETRQYRIAIEIANGLDKFVGRGSGRELLFVGHSLGGGLAAAQAMATNRRGTSFNAAGVKPEVVRSIQKSLIGKEVSYNVRDIFTNYNADGDPMTSYTNLLPFMPDQKGDTVPLTAGYNTYANHNDRQFRSERAPGLMSRGAMLADPVSQHSRGQLLNGLLRRYYFGEDR